MEVIKELKKSKRELKSTITRALSDLAICLAAKELDCTQISASLEHIERKKEEVLAIMRDLETEFVKIKKTEEAEKIGDEADALVDQVDKETNTARSYLAAQVKMSSSKPTSFPGSLILLGMRLHQNKNLRKSTHTQTHSKGQVIQTSN